MWHNLAPLSLPMRSCGPSRSSAIWSQEITSPYVNPEGDSEALGHLEITSPREMRSEIEHVAENVPVQARTSKTVKNEWTLRKGIASNNSLFGAKKCCGVGRSLKRAGHWLCFPVLTAENMRNLDYDSISSGNTVYARVTHPNRVSPFSFNRHDF